MSPTTTPGDHDFAAVGYDNRFHTSWPHWKCTSDTAHALHTTEGGGEGNAAFAIGILSTGGVFNAIQGSGSCIADFHLDVALLKAISAPKAPYMLGELSDLTSFDDIVFLYRGYNWRNGNIYTLLGARNLASLARDRKL